MTMTTGVPVSGQGGSVEAGAAPGDLKDERKRIERDLAVGEWARARRRAGEALERLTAIPESGEEEIREWLRLLGWLAEVPPPPARSGQLAIWPDGERAREGGRVALLPPRGAAGNPGAAMGVITRDPALLAALTLLENLAPTDLPVLLEGESGTGKEVVARGIHRESRYGRAPFVAVNCGALPAELHESELFGHARGAYTGAAVDKPGLFEAAHGGTIFLDEIGEMDPRAQVKLLRVLETGEVRRLGEVRTRMVKARVIAATNARVDRALAEGRFRADLLHRLAAIRVTLPPLRERRGDILPLAGHFLRRCLPAPPALTPAARMALLRHPWPGNVRELKYTMERAAALWTCGSGAELSEEFLLLDGQAGRQREERAAQAGRTGCAVSGEARQAPPRSGDAGPPALSSVAADDSGAIDGRLAFPEEVPAGHTIDSLLAEIERGLIARALAAAGGNRTVAARLLGNLSRTTLIGKMKRLGLFQIGENGGAPDGR